MKAVSSLLVLLCILSCTTTLAQKKRMQDSVDVTIRLSKHFSKSAPVDSVFVFFDRFDHSGAGIIKRVYYPVNNQILIPDVPEGRYFIGLYCLGSHLQYFSNITFINKKRSNKLKFYLNRSEEYIPGTYIPASFVDFSKLAITNTKSFK